MSQQIQASIPSPVSPAPQAQPADAGSSYQQWVPAPTQAVVSAPTPQQPSQATAPSAPTTSPQYSQSPSAYSQSSPANPWEAAMGSLERVLAQTAPAAYPSQGQQSVSYQAPQLDTQQYSQPSVGQEPYLYQAPTAQPTYPSSASTTQASSPTSTAPELSEATSAVVNHFGIEAPAILNQYATVLEDALIQQNGVLQETGERAQRMEHILTDPDQLADYTDRFFTEVYPVDIDGTQQPQVPTQEYQQQFDQMPAVPAAAGQGAPQVNPEAQWEGFSNAMNQNQEQAWRYLSQMTPDAFRSKLLFLDNG